MKVENIVSRLLVEADPSIRYRINREILLTPSDAQDMRALQSQIEGKKAQDVVPWPQETYLADGWIGHELHVSLSVCNFHDCCILLPDL
jgi:hypothetical protein